MKIVLKGNFLAALAAMLLLAGCAMPGAPTGAVATGAAPKFAVDPYWPKPLPGNWILGQVSGIAVAKDDTIWVVHRPSTLVEDEKGAQLTPPATKCCNAAPPVLQFDREGNLLRSWGGPGAGYDWPKSEHGIFIDADGNVWVGANDPADAHILKFTPDGKFLMQIGKANSTGGSNSTTQLGRPAHMIIDARTNELYVADGYLNRRVIVFDAATGNYKRHWGAYGNKPNDDKQAVYNPKAALSPQFGSPVHCVRLSNDGLLYVCDRVNDRIQIFKKDGTFVKEYRVSPETLQNGSVWDLVLSEDAQQKYIFIADGANNEIVTLRRDTGEVVTSWGRAGRMAGQFKWVHNMAIDSRGNLYTAEVGFGRRAQKFNRVE